MVAIAHAAPTFCIQVPIFETIEAIQIQRNQVKSSGLHELSLRSGVAAAV
jgi:hypothetical protein